MALIYYEKGNFEDLIAKDLTIVDFYADWCGPCKILLPIIERIASELVEIKIIKVNVDNHEDLARKYKIMSIPTLVFFKDGEEQKKHIGLLSEEKIREIIDEL